MELLRLEGLSKRYIGTQALDAVDMTIEAGQVLCLAGANGSGKSTLMKCIAGGEAPDSGRIIWQGQAFERLTAAQSMALGIEIIYQDLSIFPDLTVAENIAFHVVQSRHRGWVDWSEVDRIAAKALHELGADLPLRARLGDLPIGARQTAAIARALTQDCRLLVMDEPTTALPSRDVAQLLNMVRRLKSKGMAIIFISHKLDELFHIADRMTVLRDGKLIGTAPTGEMNRQKLISMMVGREISEERLPGKGAGDVVLEVKNISKAGNYQNVSFQLRRGEVLGITGLVGAGRTETVLSLFGLNQPDSGEIFLEGKKILPKSPAEAKKLGIAFVPESRQTEGLVLQQDAESNLTLPILGSFANRLGLVDFKKRRKRALELISKLGVRPAYPQMQVLKFSGGNQQKIVVAKWLATNPKVLIVDEPTNGIDVGAKSEIHKLLRSLADSGIAVIMVSSELPEIFAISDRILVMRRGRVTGEFDGATANQEMLMERAVLA